MDATAREPLGWLDRLLYYAGALTMLAIAGVMTYAVSMRYFFNRPPMWSEDIPRLLFLWMVFLTAGVAIKRGYNIRCTYFIDTLPRRVQSSIEIAMHLLVLAMLAFLFVQSFPVVRLSWSDIMLSTGFSRAAFTLPLPVGCVLIFGYQAARLAAAVRNFGRGGGPAVPPAEHGAGLG